VRGVRGARGTTAAPPASREIRGSTTIVELLRMFPDGEAGKLLGALALPCAHCGGAFHEPLTLAAKRHGRDPRALLEACRALEHGTPRAEQLEAARRRPATPAGRG
jgi:hypothetical protein